MKNLKFLLFCVLLINCKKEETAKPIISIENIDQLPTILDGKIWKVSSLKEVNSGKTEDKTSMFSEVQLMFSPDKTIMAHKGADIITGTWQKGEAVSYGQPTELSAYSFTINLGKKQPYDRISNQWIVKELTNKMIKMDHVNPAENKHFVLEVE